MVFSLQSRITKNSSNSARVNLIDISDTVIASSYELRNCLDECRKHDFPADGTIKFYYGNNNIIISTSSIENISGGNSYSYN